MQRQVMDDGVSLVVRKNTQLLVLVATAELMEERTC